MNALQPWQRMLYFLGETVMVGGLLWGLYRAIVIRGCPISPLNDITLIVVGLAIATIPLHPFGQRRYIAPFLRNLPAAAVLWWVFALLGLGISLFLRFQLPVPVGYSWFFALVPAGLYFWFAIPSKLTDKPKPAVRAPEPPEKKNDTDSESDMNDQPEQGAAGDA